MQWSDIGIILSTRRHGESSLILKIFTPTRGVHAGLVRTSARTRAIYQTGNIVNAVWKARLEEYLGNYVCELKASLVGFVMGDALKLSGLQSACAMVEQTLPERDPHPSLYYTLEDFIFRLKESQDWLSHYILLEIELLRNLGFGLDLEKCAATGTRDNLAYVSPRTGRAVSLEAGEPHKDKLFRYPHFPEGIVPALEDVKAGLALTEHFLTEHFFAAHHRRLPAVRSRLAAMLAS